MSLDQVLGFSEPEQPTILQFMGSGGVVRSPEVDNKLAMEIASVRASTDPSKSFKDHYEIAKNEVASSEDPRAQILEPMTQQLKKVSTDTLKSHAMTRLRAGEDVNQVLGDLAFMKGTFDNTNQWNTEALINAAVFAAPQDQYRVLKDAADASPYMYIQKRMAEEGRTGVDWEDVTDWAGLIFWPDTSLESDSIVEAVNKSGIMQVGSVVDLAKKYQALTPPEAEQLWDVINPVMFDVMDGNDLKMASFIQTMQAYDPQAERNFTVGIDVVTAAAGVYDFWLLLGSKAASTALKSKKAQSAIQALKKAGQTRVAGEAELVRAAESGDTLTAGKNASPYNMEGTALDGPNVVDGLAADIKAALDESINAANTRAKATQAARTAALEQKAGELDVWVDEQLAKTGGQKKKQLEKELQSLQTLREERLAAREQSSLSDLERTSAELNEVEARIARVQESLDAHEAAALGKQYARSMRSGRVPEEFSGDIRAIEDAVLARWEKTSAGTKARAVERERAAQEAEVQKMRDELNVELHNIRRLSTAELADLRAEAAHVNRKLNEAKAAGDQRAVTELQAQADELKSLYAEHMRSYEIEGDLRYLETRDFSPAQRERLRNVTGRNIGGSPRAVPESGAQAAKAEAGAAKAAPGATAGAAPAKVAGEAKYSSDAGLNKIIEEHVQETASILKGYENGDAYIDIARSAFHQAEIAKTKAKISASNRAIKEVRVVSQTEDSLTVKYVLEDGELTENYIWNADSLGRWSVQELADSVFGAVSTKILTPTAVTRNLDKTLVQNMTLGGMQTAAIYNNLIKLTKDIFKNLKLNPEQSAAVERLLMQGDTKGEVYDAKAMLYTDQIMGRRWTEAEVLAYFEWRTVYDGLWSVQNAAVQRAMAFQGWKELRVSGFADDVMRTITGKKNPSETKGWTLPVRAATEDEINLIGRRTSHSTGKEIKDEVFVLDDTGLVTESIGKQELADRMREGFEVFRVHDGAALAGKRGQFFLLKQGNNVKLDKLRKMVLHYNVGYIPRLYKPGYVFLKDARSYKTIGGFSGKKEALAYRSEMQADDKWVLVHDREMTPEQVQLEQIDGAGGLWFMPRRGEALTNPSQAKALERLDLGSATQSYLNSISSLLPLNEYRTGVLRQFEKAVRDTAKQNGGIGFMDNTNLLTAKISTGNQSADKVLEHTRQYIHKQLGFRTYEESSLNGWLSRVADRMEGTAAGGKPRELVQWAANLDPIERVKAGVFHVYLGCFNPAQLFVQMQNAVLATTVAPQYALQAWYDAVKMRTVLLADREGVEALSRTSGLDLAEAHSDLAKLGWFDRGKRDAAALKRSGYLDSIYRQGDFNTQLTGMGGTTMQAARKVLRTGAIPFEEGELFSRLVAFNIAKRQWKARNPKGVLDDDAISSIVQESLRINLNMQKENAAMWQSHWLTAIPTQFLQVQAKFWEQVMGGLLKNAGGGGWKNGNWKSAAKSGTGSGWTAREAAQAGAGQLAIYGTVAVPGYMWMQDFIAKQMGYVSEDGTADVQTMRDENPGLVEAYEEGLMGWMFNQGNVNVNVSDRFSIPAGLDDNVVYNLAQAILDTTDETKRAALDLNTLSPAIGVLARTSDKVHSASLNLYSLFTAEEAGVHNIQEAVWNLAQIATTFNNLEKADLWEKTGHLYSRSGNNRLDWDDDTMNFQTRLFVAFGFKTDDEFNAIQRQNALQDIESYKDKAAMFQRKAMIAWADGNPGLHSVYSNLAKQYAGGEIQYQQIQMREFQKMYSGESGDDRTTQKLRRAMMNGENVKVEVQ